MTEQEFRKKAEAEIDEDAMAKADGLEPRPGVKEHYEEMTEIGANARGEGRVP